MVETPETNSTLENIQLQKSNKSWYLASLVAAVVIMAVLGALWWSRASIDPQISSLPLPMSIAEPEPTHKIPSPPVNQNLIGTIPSSKVLPGGSHTFQTFNNCGPAALSMTLSHYGITATQQALGQALRPYQQAQGNNDDKSVTLAEVASKAQEYGFVTYLRPAGNIDILQAFVAHDMPVVARTWLHEGEDIGHFRVVKGYDQTRQILIQDDSLQGKDLEYSYGEFESLWQAFNYEFLVLVPIEKQALAEAILGGLLNEEATWQKALEISDAQLTNNPNDLYANFNASVALHHLGRHQDSVDRYENVASRLPSRMLWYQLEPVVSYYHLGSYDQVITIADRILNNNNRAYSELYYLKALVAEQRGDTNSANALRSEATRYNTTNMWRINVP